ncbi:MAG: hypothetical protein Q8O57_11645, partial [Kiritimatiellota bacterium]|nr:hypothetical protein [Kiritimatiellota bacterium]
MKSLAIFFIALGLLLTGMALPVCAQDETNAPAVSEVSAEKPVAAESTAPAATVEVSTETTEQPAATNAAPATETPKATDTAAPAAVEKTEPVSQAEAPAPAVE